MAVKIGCAACQFDARLILGSKPLCYFCARQIIFEMVRGNSKVSFFDDSTVGGLKEIRYRLDSKKPTSKT